MTQDSALSDAGGSASAAATGGALLPSPAPASAGIASAGRAGAPPVDNPGAGEGVPAAAAPMAGANAAGHSASRSWRRNGAAGVSGVFAGAGGSGGAAGRMVVRAGAGGTELRAAGTGSGQSSASAGAGSSGAGAAPGCVVNLACQLPAAPSTGDAHADCVDRINQFRQQCACLPALERWVEGEACADEMAKYDSGGTQAHAGFGANICDGGSAQNECPGWRSEAQIVSVCLQKMWDEGPPPMSDCTGSCFQTYGHFLNMTNKRMTKVACGFYETADGQFWSVQNFAR